MCGICGVIGPAGRARTEDVAHMTRALAHRGPDDEGTWQTRFTAEGRDWQVGFGHTRLSIIDLSANGHEPMLSPDGDTVVTYNGEIYNFRELRTELVDRGVRFRSECDAEVLLEAYRAWGPEAVERFNGMFAFAIWDAARHRLVLARDRLGIKPLYFREEDGVLTFGSELGALRAHSGFRADISPIGLESYLRYGYTTGEQTIYARTRRLLPGELLVWQNGETSRRNYWRVTDHPPEPAVSDFEGTVDRLEATLGDAVEARLVSDVPLGAFLSGGVDSSTVVALAKERAKGPVRTFAIGFEQESFDEAPHARAVAQHLGTEHTELYVTRDQARRVLRELPTLYDEPYADPSAIPTLLLCRMTREHVTVALSGDGGDELFGGYLRYAKLAQALRLRRLPAWLRGGLQLLSGVPGGESLRNGLRKLEGDRDEAEIAETFLSRFEDADLRTAARLGDGARGSTFRDVFRAAPTPSPVRRAMYAEARTYLNDDVLVKVDRASMSVGLEARVPLLDHRVVEQAFRTDAALLSHDGQTKAPLRAVLYRHVPRALIERPKRGFGFPVRALLGEDLEKWSGTYLAPARIADEGVMDADAVSRMVAGARSRGAAGDTELWRLLCFQRWLAVNHRGEDPS